MFIITKTFTDDEGHLYTKVNPKQYSTPKEAYDAMREDYLNELKSRGLDDNGGSNEDGESCPHCDADLGGDCNDGYYQNPHYERRPVCGQKLKYI